jgi:signal peptide peptidase SppA
MNVRSYLLSLGSPYWAIREEWLKFALSTRIEINAVRSRGRPPRIKGSVAALALHGPIAQRRDIFMDFFGGTSTEEFGAELDRLMADSTIGAVVFDVDSPGGSVAGVQELADKIYAYRGTKPMIAVADSEAASAAYWIASAADEVVVTPSGEVGSIGVVAIHADSSEALAQAGLKLTIVSAGKYKAEGNPYEPLDDEARDYVQSRVDEYYADFVKAVARNRGTTASAVRGGYGEGRMVGAKDAVKMGMADRIATFDTVVAGLRARSRRRTAAAFRLARLRLLDAGQEAAYDVTDN